MMNARLPEGKPSALESLDSSAEKFVGTDNPRHLRALALLMQRPAKREELDRAAGCSNGPELVAELRRRGLSVPCKRVEALDRDGRPCRPGVYHLTCRDRRKVSRWLSVRDARRRGFITPELVTWLALLAGPAAVAAAALLRTFGWL